MAIENHDTQHKKVQWALVTGGAVRIGASICTTLHEAGYNILMHYGRSQTEAEALSAKLNAVRPNSCFIFSANLSAINDVTSLIAWVKKITLHLHVLVNNASVFYPTPWLTHHSEKSHEYEEQTMNDWENIFNVNARAPYLLCKGLLKPLQASRGSVINIIDIHAERTLSHHPAYCASKAALKNLTLSLAKDHGATLQSNGVSPGAISWPETSQDNNENNVQASDYSLQKKQVILQSIPKGTMGNELDIANAVLFLTQSKYINGHILNVDGGRLLNS